MQYLCLWIYLNQTLLEFNLTADKSETDCAFHFALSQRPRQWWWCFSLLLIRSFFHVECAECLSQRTPNHDNQQQNNQTNNSTSKKKNEERSEEFATLCRFTPSELLAICETATVRLCHFFPLACNSIRLSCNANEIQHFFLSSSLVATTADSWALASVWLGSSLALM